MLEGIDVRQIQEEGARELIIRLLNLVEQRERRPETGAARESTSDLSH
jgi:hypothetical protein